MKPRRLLSGLLVLLIISSCSVGSLDEIIFPGAGEPPVTDEPAQEPGLESSDWFQVYFTAPDAPQASTLRGGPDAHLAEAIHQARLSVDVAMDSLDLWSLRDALLAAHRRGVAVRVVIESDGLDSAEVQELQENGIQIVDDRQDGLMHNKFAIIDRLEVWSGSMNFTLNGAYRSDNNLIRIQSADIAENYLVEFEEMFLDHQFGSKSPANTPLPMVNVGGTQVEVYFSPDDG